MRVRTNLVTGWPTASHMRRTWRLRPSWIVMRSTPGSAGHLGRRGGTVVQLDTLAEAAIAPGGTVPPATVARYSFSTPCAGWAMRLASSPSLVRIRRPSVSASRRPRNTRGVAGTSPVTVGRPWVSLAVVTTPAVC